MRENIPNNFIDLTVTSPPYDDLRKYNGFVFDYKSIANELYRVTKIGGIVVWVVGDQTIKGSETGTSFEQALYFKSIGFNIHDTMIYAKNKTMPRDPKCNRYGQDFEYMFIFSKEKPKTCNYIRIPCKHAGQKAIAYQKENDYSTREDRIKNQQNHVVNDDKPKGNIWYYTNKSIKGHPAPFPEQLAHDHIISWSNDGDIVFDPMCGSGTTCKESFLLHRNFIGVDMSEEYINNICIPRLKEYGWNNEAKSDRKIN